MALSKTQIDRLGDRLKLGAHIDDDLRLLDDYRRSFGEAYQLVIQTILQRGALPTGRLAKSTVSIIEKLRRESLRLTQMQDIAGCRIVVGNVIEQDQLVAALKVDFTGASVIDRRDHPSHGYRAVHIVAQMAGKPVEIQVRSSLQHLWAEVSEKSSDVLDPAMKYGGGSPVWRKFLADSSESVAAYEYCEKVFSKAMASIEQAVGSQGNLKDALAQQLQHGVPGHVRQAAQKELDAATLEISEAQRAVEKLRQEQLRLGDLNINRLTQAIAQLDQQARQKP